MNRQQTILLLFVGVGSLVTIASIVAYQFVQQQTALSQYSQEYERQRCLSYYEDSINKPDWKEMYLNIYKQCLEDIGLHPYSYQGTK